MLYLEYLEKRVWSILDMRKITASRKFLHTASNTINGIVHLTKITTGKRCSLLAVNEIRIPFMHAQLRSKQSDDNSLRLTPACFLETPMQG